ncbi:hypothetical protein CDL15_Pgr004927 [Punica granatum]|uniref:Uncharacterized protein n=1 Tax=Punica granatum TaxID=22663 RepID=A0A218WV91_PUNGR|nr:hypothetical protein CDL15_Pgr004927 [Punica granatum]PKI49208.1 hypothetical protein CRG98_030397 [Punica granatum]
MDEAHLALSKIGDERGWVQEEPVRAQFYSGGSSRTVVGSGGHRRAAADHKRGRDGKVVEALVSYRARRGWTENGSRF